MIGAAVGNRRGGARGCSNAVAAAALALSAVAAAADPKTLTDEEVTAAVKEVIAERSKDGVFAFHDVRSGEQLALVLDDVRVVRGLPVFGWFPNVVFHDKDIPAKKYALDFWLKPDGDRLKLMDIRIHKAPQADGSSWMSMTRAPLPWWWLPTIKRVSAVVGMQAWQVMGAIQTHIVDARKNDAVVLADASGAPLSLQLVDLLQPVGKSKADGRYFACAEFRKFGSEATNYSITYWLDPQTKLVTAGSVHAMDAGTGERKAAAEPRCDVGGIAFDIVD